ncbi:hypothetical protein ACFSTD_18470 [Novosphingobium colocasiae]
MTQSAYSAIRQELAADPQAALRGCTALLARNPDDAEAHRLAGRAWRAVGDDERAVAAELAAIDASVLDPVLVAAGRAMVEKAHRGGGTDPAPAPARKIRSMWRRSACWPKWPGGWAG